MTIEAVFGEEEGAICGRQGCEGLIVFEPENCSCHINPPCGQCTDHGLTCRACGWRQGDE